MCFASEFKENIINFEPLSEFPTIEEIEGFEEPMLATPEMSDDDTSFFSSSPELISVRERPVPPPVPDFYETQELLDFLKFIPTLIWGVDVVFMDSLSLLPYLFCDCKSILFIGTNSKNCKLAYCPTFMTYNPEIKIGKIFSGNSVIERFQVGPPLFNTQSGISCFSCETLLLEYLKSYMEKNFYWYKVEQMKMNDIETQLWIDNYFPAADCWFYRPFSNEALRLLAELSASGKDITIWYDYVSAHYIVCKKKGFGYQNIIFYCNGIGVIAKKIKCFSTINCERIPKKLCEFIAIEK